MSQNTFVLVDGNAILHRAYHAMPRFEVEGQLVNALYGFISTLFLNISKFEPKYLAVAFDVKGPTFRDEIFDKYKAGRIKPPQEFYDQIPLVHKFLEKMEIPLLTKQGFEADDIIGTLVKHINGDLKDGEIVIVTGDQDSLQLVDSQTKVAMPAMGKVKETLYDSSAVIGKLGITPAQVIDYKALSGDASDNIPGVKGIGSKTALALLKEFKSVKNIYKNLSDGSHNNLKGENGKLIVTPRIEKLLLDGKESAFMSRELATIKTDVALNFKLKDAILHDFDQKILVEFLQKYRFRSLINRMPQSRRTVDQQERLF